MSGRGSGYENDKNRQNFRSRDIVSRIIWIKGKVWKITVTHRGTMPRLRVFPMRLEI